MPSPVGRHDGSGGRRPVESPCSALCHDTVVRPTVVQKPRRVRLDALLVDRFQLAMVDSFVRALDSRWSVRLEVPVTKPARGVIDAVLADRTAPLVVASEFQSEFRRVEQQIRWNNEKADGLAARLQEEARGDPAPSVSHLLVLRSTTATREVARRYEAVLRAAYPARTADLVKALTSADMSWPGPGIVWMRLEKGKADLLEGPPRGVRLGR